MESGARYRFHDLIGLLAEERLAAETQAAERDAALTRLFDAYLAVAARADAALAFGGLHRLEPLRVAPGIEAAADRFAQDAPRWFDGEQYCLLAAVERAAEEGLHDTVCQLSATLAAYLELRARWDELVRVAELSLAAARATGDHYWTAYAYFGLGLAARERRDLEAAKQHFGQCLATLPAANDRFPPGDLRCGQRSRTFVEPLREPLAERSPASGPSTRLTRRSHASASLPRMVATLSPRTGAGG